MRADAEEEQLLSAMTMLVMNHTAACKIAYDINPINSPFMWGTLGKRVVINPDDQSETMAFLNKHMVDANRVKVNWDPYGDPYTIVDHLGYRTYSYVVEIRK